MRRVPLLALALLTPAAAACNGTRPDPGFTTRPSTVVVSSGAGTMTLGAVESSMASARVVAKPTDSVWRVLPAVFDSLALPVTTVRTEEHVLGSEATRVRRRLAGVPLSTYLRCGGAMGIPNADSYDVQISVVTQLQPGEGTNRVTNVLTLVSGSAKSSATSNGSVVTCSSTGKLEERIQQLLRAQLAL
ncbi:MAG TPA: hypothetical protein VKA84_01770 [Gemmatimonadaceae bacterium]|nr:hypothetical protein [Gemmatimonadaceae bacterium]